MAHEAADRSDATAAREDGAGEPSDDPPQPAGRSAAGPATPIEVRADPGLSLPPRVVPFVTARLTAAADVLSVPVERLVVRLVADPAMQALHRRHCDRPDTTDVLTFPSSAPDEPLDADIACCVDEAARQAAVRGHALEEEVLLYALHGVLHCLGHDDHDPTAYERMHAEEDRVLTAIGVGPRFATEEHRSADDGSDTSDPGSPAVPGARS